METRQCYKCDDYVYDLSPRGRCVWCEHASNRFNESENEVLREHILKLEAKQRDSHLVRTPMEKYN